MKKMFIALLFVVSTIFSVSAKTVVVELECGEKIMTDDSCFVGPDDYEDFYEVMSDEMC